MPLASHLPVACDIQASVIANDHVWRRAWFMVVLPLPPTACTGTILRRPSYRCSPIIWHIGSTAPRGLHPTGNSMSSVDFGMFAACQNKTCAGLCIVRLTSLSLCPECQPRRHSHVSRYRPSQRHTWTVHHASQSIHTQSATGSYRTSERRFCVVQCE